jgi:YVTN family beta-propeller protein
VRISRDMMRSGALLLLLFGGCAARVPSAAPPAPPSGALLATIPVGPAPTLLAMAPGGRRLYAASSGTLSVIDTAANAEVTRLNINPNSTGIAIAPDGSQVYIANLFSITLTVLDTATNTLASPITMFAQRRRGGFGLMAVAPDGRTIYIANRGNRGFGIVPLQGGGRVLRPSVAPVDLAVSSDGRTVYSAGCKPICTPGFVNLFDTATRRFGDEIAVGGNPFRIVLSPDGSRAYVANLTGPSISVVDLAGRRVTGTFPVPTQPTGLAVAPDGGTLYVASQTEGRLTALDAASGATRGQLTAPQARDVTVSPDGRSVYVSTANAVLVVDAQALVRGQ